MLRVAKPSVAIWIAIWIQCDWSKMVICNAWHYSFGIFKRCNRRYKVNYIGYHCFEIAFTPRLKSQSQSSLSIIPKHTHIFILPVASNFHLHIRRIHNGRASSVMPCFDFHEQKEMYLNLVCDNGLFWNRDLGLNDDLYEVITFVFKSTYTIHNKNKPMKWTTNVIWRIQQFDNVWLFV